MSYDLDTSDIEGFTGTEGEGDPSGSVKTSETTQTSTTEPQRFKYTANGKEIEEDLDTILQRASQGYNYAQHMQDFKTKQEAFTKEQESINQMKSKWEQYDKYATENPEWAEHVKTQWDQRLNSVEQNAEAGNALPEDIRNELAGLKQFKADYERDVKLRQEAEEDAVLAGQFDEIVKEYPDYDLKHTDPATGMSLEMQVLEHARTNGIHSMRAAFRDMKWDDLVAKQVTKAKETTAKELASRTQKGFLGTDSESMVRKSISARQKGGPSYTDDIMDEAQELGII